MNKQELIENYKNILDKSSVFAVVSIYGVLDDLEKLDEPKTVKVPQFVAEIIEYYKKQNATLYDALREKNFNKKYNDWLLNEQGAYDKVARAWLFGYEVEKEKRYRVKLKSNSEEIDYLVNTERNGLRFYSTIYTQRREHTRKELEDAGFDWVFDCPGIEVEEVEE